MQMLRRHLHVLFTELYPSFNEACHRNETVVLSLPNIYGRFYILYFCNRCSVSGPGKVVAFISQVPVMVVSDAFVSKQINYRTNEEKTTGEKIN